MDNSKFPKRSLLVLSMDIKAFEKLTQLLDIERDLLRSEQEIASGAPLKSAEEVAASYGIHKK